MVRVSLKLSDIDIIVEAMVERIIHRDHVVHQEDYEIYERFRLLALKERGVEL